MATDTANIDVAKDSLNVAIESKPPRELTMRSGFATLGAFIAFFVSVGFNNAFGVFQDYYSQDVLRQYSASQISWLGSFANFSIYFFGIPAGHLADRFGPTIPMSVGFLSIVVAIFMISLCSEYYQFFLAQGLLLGFGMSFVAIPATGVVPRYFARHRAAATGFAVAGSSLGGVIWPIILDQLFYHHGISFGWSMRIAGFIMLPLTLFTLTTVRLPTRQVQVDILQDSGHATKTEGERRATKVKKPPRDLSVLRKPPFILLCSGIFIATLGFFAPLFYITVYATHLGFSQGLAYYLLSILNGASLFGRILPGIIADHLGRFNLITISAVNAGIVGFCWSSATSIAGVIVWSAAYGFASGALLSLQFACATTLADKDSAGIVVGITMTSASIAALITGPICGILVERGYLALAWYTGATFFTGAGLLAVSRLSQNRDIKAKL